MVAEGSNSTQVSPQEAVLQKLILDPDLERLKDALAEFNLFDVLGVARSELQHSAFLGWLLNPHGSHGLRDYFLRRFLSEATKEARERGIGGLTPFDVDGWALSDIRVVTERQLRSGRGRIDILVVGESDGFVCLIENKIGTDEHSGQLSRYLETVEREYGEHYHLPIFLTPDGVAPAKEGKDAERYVPIGYAHIAEIIQRVLKTRESTISTSVYTFLSQYKSTLGRHIVSTPDNIDKLAYRIYANNRAAIDRIIKAKDLPGALDMTGVIGIVPQHAPDLQQDTHALNNLVRFFAPPLDEITELRQGKGWTQSGRMVLIEVGHDPRHRRVNIVLTVGPGPKETRDRLIRVARSSHAPFRRFRLPAALKAKYTHVYRKGVLSPRTYDPFKLDEAQLTLEKAIADFYQKDYYPLINAIRAEFGLDPVV